MEIPPPPTRIVTSQDSWKLMVDILNTVRDKAYKDGFADGYNKGLSEVAK